MAIKVKYKAPYHLNPISKGDWVDLHSDETVTMFAPKVDKNENVKFDEKLISLGIAMELPKGFYAEVLPRSSVMKNFGIILANSQGVIDNSFRGNEDIWRFYAVALRDTIIHKNDRICQFQIHLSQNATFWQKLKWLLSSKVEFEKVEYLEGENRGGHGTTGIN